MLLLAFRALTTASKVRGLEEALAAATGTVLEERCGARLEAEREHAVLDCGDGAPLRQFVELICAVGADEPPGTTPAKRWMSVESTCAALDDAQALWKEYETYAEEGGSPGFVPEVRQGGASNLPPPFLEFHGPFTDLPLTVLTAFHQVVKEAMTSLETVSTDGFTLLPLGWPTRQSWHFLTVVAGAEARMSTYRAASLLAAAVRGFLTRRIGLAKTSGLDFASVGLARWLWQRCAPSWAIEAEAGLLEEASQPPLHQGWLGRGGGALVQVRGRVLLMASGGSLMASGGSLMVSDPL